jgi:hypothetical protein
MPIVVICMADVLSRCGALSSRKERRGGSDLVT